MLPRCQSVDPSAQRWIAPRGAPGQVREVAEVTGLSPREVHCVGPMPPGLGAPELVAKSAGDVGVHCSNIS